MKPARDILVIEDNAEDRYVLRRYLARDPAYTNSLREVATGGEGLVACRQSAPDAVLLDFWLPDMTGLEVLTSIGSSVPVVMVTGAGNEETAIQALELGAQDYLGKEDMSPTLLSRAITNAVTKKRLRRALEAALSQAQRLAKENAQICEEARGAAAIREKVLSVVAHDLRSPLNVVMAQQRILEQQLDAGATPCGERLRAAKVGLARIGRAAFRMQAMLQELLDVSRLHAGKSLDLSVGLTDLVAVVRSVLDDHRETTPHRKIELETAEATLIGMWDRACIERVITNLVSNALKYSPAGSPVTVAIRREEDGAAGLEIAVVTVTDLGFGIPASDLPQLFEWFHRASNVRERIPGTGVGLASARCIVEQHGGALSVESREGEGSTFMLRLPLGADPTAPTSRPRSRGNGHGGPNAR